MSSVNHIICIYLPQSESPNKISYLEWYFCLPNNIVDRKRRVTGRQADIVHKGLHGTGRAYVNFILAIQVVLSAPSAIY